MAHWVTNISQHTIIVNSEGNVLLLQNVREFEDGTREVEKAYTFPGGRLEENETPLEGLIREVKEETGLTRIKVLLPINTSIYGRTHRRFSVVYLARLLDDNEPIVLQDSEAAGYRWESFADACKLPLVSEGFRDALATAEKLWAMPEIRDL